MWHLIIMLLLSMAITHQAFARSEGNLEAGLVNPGYEEKPKWFKNSFLDIREDVEEAAENDKKVMLYFYQDGCPYCEKLINDNFADQAIADQTQKHFDTIAINLWGDAEVTDLSGNTVTEKEFGRELKVMFTPTLLMLDKQGEVAMRINGYYAPHKFTAALNYVGDNYYKKTSFIDFAATQETAKATGKLHNDRSFLQPPLRLSSKFRYGNKPLLVLFEQKVCAVCDEWHLDIFKRPETKKLLKEFDVVLLDMRSKTPIMTPDGKKFTAEQWAKELGILYAPSMVFFDDNNEQVFSTGGYLKAFHVQSVMDYVRTASYKTHPEFQRYIDERADALRAQGIEVDLWK